MAEKTPPRGIEKLTDLPLALAVRGVGAVLSRVDPRRAYSFARFLGRAWYRIIPGRMFISRRNLEIAFRGALSREKREEILRESYCHAMATAVGVFLRDRVITPSTWPRFFSLDGEVEDVIRRKHPRGLIILSAHLGDWEMIHHLLAIRGLKVAAVARSIHNPHLDRLATELRTSQGATLIPKAGALHGTWKVLRAGGAAGLMTDQSAKPGDSYQKFFGSSCATYFQYARLLARARPEVVFIACLREGFSFRFHLQGRDLTPALEGPGDENERAQNLIGAYLMTLEELIRAHPEQYLWMHRRWKYRPPGAPDLYQRLREPLQLGLLEPAFPREEAGAPEVS